MGYKLNPFTGNFDLVDSKWSVSTYGSADWVYPTDHTHGLLAGQAVDDSVGATFAGATALFNGDPQGSNAGIGYFVNLSYGTGFTGFGALFVATRAKGTPVAPAQVLATEFVGGLVSAAFDDTGTFATAGASHILPGLIFQAAQDVSNAVYESNMWIGGLITPMITLETDTNAIIFNQSQFDSDITFYNDTGTTLTMDGATGTVTFGGTASFSSGLGIDWGGTNNDIYANTGTGIVTVRGVNGVNTRVGSTDILTSTSTGLVVTGTISSPSGSTNGERFGDASVVSGSNGVAFGYQASSTGSNSVAIGRAASDGGFSGAVAIGYSADAAGTNSFSLGRNATAASQSIAIGYNADASAGATSVVLGRDAVNTTSNQFVAGSTTYTINDIYFGTGVVSTAPVAYTINGSGGSGTDVAGADLILAGGKNTGSAAGGSLLFQTSPAGSTGTTLGTLATRMTIDTTGNVGINATPANGLLTVGTGTTTSAGGMWFGTDVNLYRSANNTLKTDDSLSIGSQIAFDASGGSLTFTPTTSGQLLMGNYLGYAISGILGAAGDTNLQVAYSNSSLLGLLGFSGAGFLFGAGGASSLDTALYRSAATTLRTNGKFIIDGELEVDGALNHDGTTVGFYGTTPVVQSAAYTASNTTTDRSYDANATTIDELADVLGTLIADLKLTGIIG